MSFPPFLFLLPLIVVPIIMHLISRKKLKRIEFSTLLFFVKNEVKLVRWFRLKRLLLLITRVALLILLIFAAANLKIPFRFFDASETVIVDKSPSMEDLEIKNKSAFIIANTSGVPQFLHYLKKHPIGILITDAQKNGFSEILKEGEKFPGIKINKKSLPPGNLGIVNVSWSPAFEGEYFVINFKILNEYAEKKKTPLILKSENKVIRKGNAILETGENLISFDIKLSKGLYAFSLEIEDREGFVFDNKFYFVVKVREKKNICILSDSFPARLTAALLQAYFDVRWVRDPADVKGDLFFTCGSGEKELLDLISNKIPGIFCLQGKTNTPISNKIPEKISSVVERSFFGTPVYFKGLSAIPVRYNCIITEGENLLYFENGDPFLSKIKNHLLLPISFEKNDLSLHPIFIPFLFGIIDFLSDKTIHNNVLLDEKIAIENSFKPDIIDPDGIKYEPYQLGENNYLFKETKKRGIYKISKGKLIRGLIAVNTHPSESKTENLSAEEIMSIFGKQNFFNGTSFFLVISFLCFVLSVFLERKILRVQ
jgi:hypothetical protein